MFFFILFFFVFFCFFLFIFFVGINYLGVPPFLLVTGKPYLRKLFNCPELRARVPPSDLLDTNQLTYEGLARQSGEKWKKLRTLLAPDFSKRAIVPKSAVIAGPIGKLVDQWGVYADKGEYLDALPSFKFLAMEVISVYAFGIQRNFINYEEENQKLLDILNEIVDDNHSR